MTVKSLDETLEVFGASYQKRVVHDDNLIDRLNHYYTAMLLFMFVVVIGTPELVGEYIECWCPEHFEDVQVEYVNYLCWISNTYYIPMSKPIPQSYEIRESHSIYYYQWSPLIFLVMAALFKIPRAIWKYLSNRSGVGLKRLMTIAKDTHNNEMIFNIRRTFQINLFNQGLPPMEQTDFFPPDIDIEVERQKTLSYLAKYIDLWCYNAPSERAGILCSSGKRAQSLFDFGIGRRHGNFFITLLIFVRFLYLFNVIGQLWLLNEFLTDDFYAYGYRVINNFLDGKDWSLNYARFPRVTLCDFDIRQLYNVQRYTLQCVLPINLYNEKAFIVIWFWLTFMAAVTLLNFLFTVVMLFTKSRENYIIKYLKLNEIYKDDDKENKNETQEDKNEIKENKKQTKEFIYSHLKFDGIFVLQVLSNNVGSAITQDIVRYLWEEFKKRADGEKDSPTLSFSSNGTYKSSFENLGLKQRNNGVLKKSTPPNDEGVQWQTDGYRNSFVSFGNHGTAVTIDKKQTMSSETLV